MLDVGVDLGKFEVCVVSEYVVPLWWKFLNFKETPNTSGIFTAPKKKWNIYMLPLPTNLLNKNKTQQKNTWWNPPCWGEGLLPCILAFCVQPSNLGCLDPLEPLGNSSMERPHQFTTPESWCQIKLLVLTLSLSIATNDRNSLRCVFFIPFESYIPNYTHKTKPKQPKYHHSVALALDRSVQLNLTAVFLRCSLIAAPIHTLRVFVHILSQFIFYILQMTLHLLRICKIQIHLDYLP